MDLGGALIAAIVAAIGGLAAVAYKHDRKWPAVRELIRFVFEYAWKTGAGIFVGVFLGWQFPSEAGTIYWTIGAVLALCFVVFVIVELADWLREP